MDPTDLSTETTSLEDLIAMAEAQGIHVEEGANRADLIDLLRASHAADCEPSPTPTAAAPASAASAASAASDNDDDDDNEAAVAASADMPRNLGGVKGLPSEGMSPPRRGLPVSFSWQQASTPEAPQFSDSLTARVMARARVDTSSSVAVEVGTDAGSIAGGGGGGGGGEGGEGSSDPDADAEPEANPEAGEASSGDAAPTSDEQREAVDTFMGITQVSSSKAVQFLEATEWSVGAAINLFMESGGDSVTTPASRHGEERASRNGDEPDGGNSPTPRSSPSAQGGSRSSRWAAGNYGWGRGVPEWGGTEARDEDSDEGDDGDEEEEIDPDDGAFIPDSISPLPGRGVPGLRGAGAPDTAGSRNNHLPRTGARGGGSAEDEDERYPGGFSEDGVRAPIPNRRDRLIGGAVDQAMHGTGAILGELIRGSLGRAGATPAEEDKTDWIFSVPEGLSFQSDFVETRQLCKEQKKWLMVNIQDHEEFASHRMNKDVWSNETILTLLRGNFVFWQRNKTLAQGRYYIDKYNLDAEMLPHIAILDPRTGTQLLKVVGYVEAQVLSMAIVEFLENNSIDQVKAPKLKTIGLSNLRARQMGDNYPGKDGHVSGRTSLESSTGAYGKAGGAGSALAYESFGSEDYEYEDEADGDDAADVTQRPRLRRQISVSALATEPTATAALVAGHMAVTKPLPRPTPSQNNASWKQGTSLDGDDTNSRTSTAVGSNANASPAHSNTPPDNSARITRGTDGSAAVAMATLMAAGGGGIPGPSGRSTEDDLQLAMALGASLKETDGADVEPVEVEDEEVPLEPEAGEGVTQVRFRLPSGGGTIARRFCMKDQVALLFQFVRTTVDEASDRPFDLLSGHPPSSLGESKATTVEDAHLRNSVIMVRWL